MRIDALVHDMVEHSARAGDIVQGPEAGPAMEELREFMFERIYLGPAVRAERERIAAVLQRLFEHYAAHPELLPGDGALPAHAGADLAGRVTDYIAGMTDRFALKEHQRLTGRALF